MIVYSASEIREWDAFTMAQEPISSINLMERAAAAFAEWMSRHPGKANSFAVFCGPGNNGGDGLAVARMLLQKGYDVVVFLVEASRYSPDCTVNLERLQQQGVKIDTISSPSSFPSVDQQAMIIDALFGTGLNKVPEGIYASLINYINALPNQVVAIDLPSGLNTDAYTEHGTVVKADFTGTFQCLKLCMLMPEAAEYVGQWNVLDIGLHPAFTDSHPPAFQMVDHPSKFLSIKQFGSFAHKGLRGHTLLGAGSATMMGAAVLAAQAALRSGTGLVTVAADSTAWSILQTAAPEAMCAARASLTNESFQTQRRVKAIGVGSGWLTDEEHTQQLAWLLTQSELPLVIDATALGLLAQMHQMLASASNPQRLVLTPHVGEFDRLFGVSDDHFKRLRKAREMAMQYKITIVLKGAYSRVVTSDGRVFFNATGNAGMAKGGSGDVLTGLIAGLLSQGYTAEEAAVLGVWLHGAAGDAAAASETTDAMTAMSIIRHLPQAWKALHR